MRTRGYINSNISGSTAYLDAHRLYTNYSNDFNNWVPPDMPARADVYCQKMTFVICYLVARPTRSRASPSADRETDFTMNWSGRRDSGSGPIRSAAQSNEVAVIAASARPAVQGEAALTPAWLLRRQMHCGFVTLKLHFYDMVSGARASPCAGWPSPVKAWFCVGRHCRSWQSRPSLVPPRPP